MPELKGPALFLDHYGYIDWQPYIALFSGALHYPLRGEATTAYLAAPECPARIYQALPDAKLIILLRDPAHRAFSAWAWMVMEGYEPIASFSEAIAAEDRRANDPQFKFKAPENFMDYLYFLVGLYAEQIERYFALFPREQIKIFLFEDLVTDSKRVYRETCTFLGIEPSLNVDFSPRNVSCIPRSVKMQYVFRRINQSAMQVDPQWLPNGIDKRSVIRIRPRWLSNFAEKLTLRLISWNVAHGFRPIRDEATVAQLRERYRVPNEKLSALIGRDLSAWM